MMAREFFNTLTKKLCTLALPPKFSIPIVSNFSSVLQLSQEKLKTMVMKNFLGKQVTLYSIWKYRTVIFSVVEVQLASVQLPPPLRKKGLV